MDELVVGIPSEVVRGGVPLLATTAVVLVAHDYKYDVPVLRHVLAAPVGYVGMLGQPPPGQGDPLDLLREAGVTEAQLARLRVPIGLDLGARSAPEIALAILAEIIATRYGGERPAARGTPKADAPA